jgi:hypothetical protein
MCAKHSLKQPAGEGSLDFRVRENPMTSSPAPGNTVRSGYRVLRGSRRRAPRSVDRDDAGRNAKPTGSSVKGSSPVKRDLPRWPSNYEAAKAILPDEGSTSGVQALGMYRRSLQELGNTPGRGTGTQSKTRRQGFIAKSTVVRPRVLRSVHSSETLGTDAGCIRSRKEVG